MSLQTIFKTAFTKKVITPEMESCLNEFLWSHNFSFQEMKALNVLTQQLESGEIVVLAA